MAKVKVLMVDPPSGWKYGFPKPVPDPHPEDMLAWYVSEGYPQAEIDRMKDHFYCRYWEQEVDDWSLTVNDYGDGKWVGKHLKDRERENENEV